MTSQNQSQSPTQTQIQTQTQTQTQTLRRGGRETGSQNYSVADKEALLEAVECVLPRSPEGWTEVLKRYNDYADINHRARRTEDSLRKKWATLVNCTKSTGDPTCPDDIRRAKMIDKKLRDHHQIASATEIGEDIREEAEQSAANLDGSGDSNQEEELEIIEKDLDQALHNSDNNNNSETVQAQTESPTPQPMSLPKRTEFRRATTTGVSRPPIPGCGSLPTPTSHRAQSSTPIQMPISIPTSTPTPSGIPTQLPNGATTTSTPSRPHSQSYTRKQQQQQQPRVNEYDMMWNNYNYDEQEQEKRIATERDLRRHLEIQLSEAREENRELSREIRELTRQYSEKLAEMERRHAERVGELERRSMEMKGKLNMAKLELKFMRHTGTGSKRRRYNPESEESSSSSGKEE